MKVYLGIMVLCLFLYQETKSQNQSIIPYKRHEVQPGETLYGIAKNYSITVEELRKVNDGLTSDIQPGQAILIPVQHKQETEGKKAKYHTVQKGDTFYALSRKYGVSVSDLQRWNADGLRQGEEAIVGYNLSKDIESENSESLVQLMPEAKPKKKEEIQEPTYNTKNAKPDGPVLPNDTGLPRVLVVPYDPYLYFSDADEEIAKASKMSASQIRYVFRKRLNILLEPSGYDALHLIGGKVKDSITELNKIYTSLSYQVMEPNQLYPVQEEGTESVQTNVASNPVKEFMNKNISPSKGQTLAKEDTRYVGAQVKDTTLFDYFHKKYEVDYFVFVNQFEVKTNYENCLDRAQQDYERSFIAHYTIYEKSGKRLSGDRIKVKYNSNSNQIYKILEDNMPTISKKILAQLPKPE